MQQTQAFGYEQVMTELLRGVVDTVGDRSGLSPERKAAAKNTAVCSVMAFNPRDPVETMLAGQCVVYDHMLHDGAKDMLRGQAEQLMIQARPGVLAAGKMFLGALGMLLRMQRRPEAQLAFARPLPVQEEAPKQAKAAPADAAEAARAEPREDVQTPGHTAPVQSAARPASTATSAPASGLATSVQQPAARGPAQRPATVPDRVAPMMIDISDAALMREIAAAAEFMASGGE